MNLSIASKMGARLRGLLGRSDFDGVLMLAPCKDVHTFGMKHPLDIAFLSSEGEVLLSLREVAPRRRVRCGRAEATLERYSSEKPWPGEGDYVEVGFAPKRPGTRMEGD